MAFLRKNFAFGTLAADINDTVTQLTMTVGHTLPISAGTFRLTIWDSINYPDPANDANLEIVTASYVSPNVYNIVRAQESTAAVAHSLGSKAALHYTSGMSEDDLTDAVVTHEATYVHTDIALNTTHRGSDGKNHSDVVTNTADIATNVIAIGLNTTHRGEVVGNPHNVTTGDIGASPTTHRHDGETLEHDAVNSDGGAFSFSTTGLVTFNQSFISANYEASNKLTVAATNAGEIDFTAGSKKLDVEDNAVVSQDYTSDASPQFAGIELGHASDTTFTRVSAGVAAIEGDNIIMASEWLQNGFPNRTDSSISFNDGTKRFTINPSSSSFDYYIAGVKYTVNSSDVLNVNYVYLGATPAEGPWYIYYDGAVLTAAVNPNHAATHEIFENKAVVAIVFWDADNSKGQLLEERHGTSMSPLTHILFHETVGARFASGLALNSITADENGSADSHAQFGVDAGTIFDEDIELTLNAIGSTTGLQIWYRDTSGWTFTTNADFSMVTAGTGRLAYDNSGTLTEVTNNYYVLCHVFASSMSHLNPIVAIGQAQYSTKKSAQQGALTEIVNILAIANISPELKPIASVIFHTNNNYGNAVKARIVSTDEGGDYVDFRTDALNPAFSSAQEHGNLAGLGDDDHVQYLLADGTRALAGAWDTGSQILTNINIDSGDINTAVVNTEWDAAYSHSQEASGNPHSVTPTELSLVIGTNTQAWDAGLDSLAGLTYASDSFIKVTAENTYAIRTIAETKTDLSLNLVENTALSTWTGTTNITTLGTIGTGTWQSTDVGIAYGGTGQSTAQLAINALSAVGAATNEHVLTKDTGTGNAIWKAAAAGGSGGGTTLLSWFYDSVIQGTWVNAADANQLCGGYTYTTTVNDGDELNFKTYLGAGTYTLKILHIRGTDCGIVDIYIDAAEVASFDFYGVSAYNIIQTQTSISVAAGGVKTIRVVIDGQNGSSTGYKAPWTALIFYRTA